VVAPSHGTELTDGSGSTEVELSMTELEQGKARNVGAGATHNSVGEDVVLPNVQACPDCQSTWVYRNGFEESDLGVMIQRYKCRDCGRRFSNQEDLKRVREARDNFVSSSLSLNVVGGNKGTSQICALGAKNLDYSVETSKLDVLQGEKQREIVVKADINLVIADYKQYMQIEHKVNDLTLSKYVFRLKWLVKEFQVDLFDPQDFKKKLAFDLVLSAKSNCNKIPHFEYKTPEYNLPLTEHMELLYASLSFQMQVFCFVLMATAARPIEALRIEWKDINFGQKTVAINHPAKHGRTRTIQMKGRFVKVIDMLAELKNQQYNIATCRNRTQRNLDRVFTYKDTDSAGENYRRAREASARRLGIPELNKITFYSNRHWRAVLERYLKGNSDAVANLLGENSDKYVAVYAPISERIYGSDKEWEPIEICETDPDYSDKMSRYGAEGYIEYNYNHTTGRHYLRKEKNVY
jgi:integrase